MKLMERLRQDRLAREAAAWTNTLDRGDPKDEAPFNVWWSQSPRHLKAAMDMAALDNELTRALSRSSLSPELPVRVPSAMPRWAIAPCAAVLLVAVVGAYFSISSLFPRTIEYSTGIGEQHLVRLDDGTSVHINTRSRIAVQFTNDTRSVELVDGEALFDVGRDSRPFQVRTGPAVIRDIGTRFNVHRRPDDIEVAVLSGEVQIALPASLTSLKPGQLAHISPRAQRSSVRVVQRKPKEIDEQVQWTTGILGFTGQSLYEVVSEVNRYNQQQLAVADNETGTVLVGGHFKANDLPSLLKALDNLGIQGARTAHANADPSPIVLSLKNRTDVK